MNNWKIVGISLPVAVAIGLGAIAVFNYIGSSNETQLYIRGENEDNSKDRKIEKLLKVVGETERLYDDAVNVFNKAIGLKNKITDNMYEGRNGMFYSSYRPNDPIFDELYIILARADDKIDNVERYVRRNAETLDWMVELFIDGTFDGKSGNTGTFVDDVSGTKDLRKSVAKIRKLVKNLSD